MLHMRFFGAPVVTLNGQSLTQIIRSPILVNLLAFLAIHRARSHARSVVAAMFWPDLPESRARQYLNTHLSRLRREFRAVSSAPYLLCDNQTIQFNSAAPFWLDVAEFEKAMSNLPNSSAGQDTLNQLEYSIDVYRADLLEGLFVDWCLDLRERLREQYLLALETLIQIHREAGRYEIALQMVVRLTRVDPLREVAHFQAVQLCAQLGRLSEAYKHYQRYETIWSDELKTAPSPRMKALLGELNSKTLMPSGLSDNEDLSGDLLVLDRLLETFRDSPECSTSEARLQREQLIKQITARAERAGRIFRARSANTQALHYLTLALQMGHNWSESQEKNEHEIALRCELDELYDLGSNCEVQADNLRKAYAIARRLNDFNKQADILSRQVWLARAQGHYEQSINLAQQMSKVCQEGGQTCAMYLALSHRLLGIVLNEMGNLCEALEHHTQSLKLDEMHKVSSGMYVDLINLAAVLVRMGRYGEAMQYLKRAQSLTGFDTSPSARAMLLGNLGNLWLKLGQWSMATDDLRHAMALAVQIGDRGIECWLGGQLALLHQHQGEKSRALNTAHHYYRVAVELEAPPRLVDMADILANLYMRNNDGNNSLIWASRADELARKHAFRRYQLRSLMRHAQAYFGLREVALAYKCVQQAVSIFETWDQPMEEEPELFWIYTNCLQKIGLQTSAQFTGERACKVLLTTAQSISHAIYRETFLTCHPAASLLSYKETMVGSAIETEQAK